MDKTNSETIKKVKKDLEKGIFDSWGKHALEWGGINCSTEIISQESPPQFMEVVKQVKKWVPPKPKAKTKTMSLCIPPQEKEEKKKPKKFKMSDFKFPLVKRINTQLACKTLQADLGEDILKDIINLDIDMKIT